MESSEWPVTGLYAGMTKHLGNWAECLRASSTAFTGRYCLARLRYDFIQQPRPSNGIGINSDERGIETASAWLSIKIFDRGLQKKEIAVGMKEMQMLK